MYDKYDFDFRWDIMTLPARKRHGYEAILMTKQAKIVVQKATNRRRIDASWKRASGIRIHRWK